MASPTARQRWYVDRLQEHLSQTTTRREEIQPIARTIETEPLAVIGTLRITALAQVLADSTQGRDDPATIASEAIDTLRVGMANGRVDLASLIDGLDALETTRTAREDVKRDLTGNQSLSLARYVTLEHAIATVRS